MTIYDIAKEAGVAASTVSRVMNNKPGIKAETRERVLEILKKNNFTPNITAQGLVMQNTKLIGILVQDIRVSHHIGSAFIIEKEMAEQGYSCITMGTGPTDEQKAEAIRKLEQRRVEAAVLVGSMFESSTVAEAIKNHLGSIPVVMINGDLGLSNVSCIIADEYHGMDACVALMEKRGRKNLVFISDGDSPSSHQKKNGFLASLRKYGLECEKERCFNGGGVTAEYGKNSTEEILGKYPETDGIIYATDLLAAGGMQAAREMGRKLPEDLSVMGIDNSEYGRITTPLLTTLDNRQEESSRMAVMFLNEGLKGNMTARKIILQTVLIQRDSV